MTWNRTTSLLSGVFPLLGLVLLSGCGCDQNDPAGDAVNQTATKGDKPPPSKPKPLLKGWDQPALALVVSGRQHGYLEPCGCSATQSGGIARRSDLMHQIEKRGWKVIGLDVGGTARPGRGTRAQGRIKFQNLISALKQMSYRALALGPEELAFGPDYILSQHQPDEAIPFLAANVVLYESRDLGTPLPYTVIEAGPLKIGVTAVLSTSVDYAKRVLPDGNTADVAIEEPAQALPAALEKLKAESPDLLVLLAHTGTPEAQQLAEQFPDFDLILTAGGPEDPDGEPTTVGQTMILQVGEKGKNVGVVGVYPDATPKLKFELVNLDKDRFQEDEAMRNVMREYQQMLQDLDVIGNSIPVTHPRETEFVGADACKSCHTLAYGVWEKSGHAHGVESLLKGGKDYAGDWIPRLHDPECIACHTAGWDPKRILRYKSGFVSLEETPHLTGQQCENCHGPASRHVALETAWEKARETVNVDELAAARKAQHLDKDTAEKNVCSKCHDLDNSPNFNFQEYWEKIKHPGKS